MLKEHIFRPSGSMKTVCVSTCLLALGIDLEDYHSTSTPKNHWAYEGVIRRKGFALRSRKSSVPKGATVGAARKAIKKLNDPKGTKYVVLVPGHLILLDSDGNTVVDTAPVKRDRRKVLRIHAVWKK